uniref:Aminotransferase class I/classII large domain-containing protein n=1 Tax=Ananas comosus var. bracteatus TaxID=296719 RepID=A0A6V7PHI4_ANACO|nr:unnamed protein product [Ananas comosus var. bracteatus]
MRGLPRRPSIPQSTQNNSLIISAPSSTLDPLTACERLETDSRKTKKSQKPIPCPLPPENLRSFSSKNPPPSNDPGIGRREAQPSPPAPSALAIQRPRDAHRRPPAGRRPGSRRPRPRLPPPLRALLLPPALPQAPPLPQNDPSASASASASIIPRTLSRASSPRAPNPRSPRAPPPSPAPTTTTPSTTPPPPLRRRPLPPTRNPDGVIQLGLAENQQLSLDLVQEWLLKNAKEALLAEDKEEGLNIRGLATYQPFDGSIDLKMAVAGFMGQVMRGSVSFNPSQIVLTSGATPAIEILSFCLADTGNAFLVPSPYYPGWDRDIKWRSRVELVPVPCRSTDNFSFSIAALERAYTQAKKRGLKVRAVLISNPSNPVGNLVNKETLYGLLEFVTEKNIHLISDEIFAGSTHGKTKFVSVAEVLDAEALDKSRVHIIYGLSKDLSSQDFELGSSIPTMKMS